MANHPLGIDFGGTGIKGAPVDLDAGDFATKRKRIATPQPATPDAVVEVFREIVAQFPDSTGPIGVTLPGVVQHGLVKSAANLDPSWIGQDADAILTDALQREVHMLNDADAAGLAEAAYGAAKGRGGVVLVTTLGTGIGSALINDGVLVPNTELGHLELDGEVAEKRASTVAREKAGLSWEEWGVLLTRYYRHLDRLFTPDLIVVGGGVSKAWESFGHLIDVDCEIVPATLKNRAGIVGAALHAARAEGAR
ncbi:MAG: ROK family protein [Nocardioides sp.]|nr:ROK family protein [Nocardioides sp.]